VQFNYSFQKKNFTFYIKNTQMKVRALYSYTAAESDETNFTGDDTLVECAYIDAD